MDWIIASAAYAFNPHEIEMQNGQSVTIKNIEAGIRAMHSGPAGELNGFALGGSEPASARNWPDRLLRCCHSGCCRAGEGLLQHCSHGNPSKRQPLWVER